MIDALFSGSGSLLSIASDVSRFTVGLLLAVAAVAKFSVMSEFREGVAALQLASRARSAWLATSVPVAEAVIAALLISNRAVAGASIAASLLFLTFASVIAVSLRPQSEPLTCRCLGVRGLLNRWAVLRNVGFAGLSCGPLFGSAAMLVLGGGGALIILGVLGSYAGTARDVRRLSPDVVSAA